MSLDARVRRRAEQRGAWTVSLAVLSTIGIPLGGLSEVVGGSSWWFAAMAVAALCVGTSWLIRAVGLPRSLAVLCSLSVWAITSVLVFAPGTAFLGVIPTPASLDALVAGLVDAGSEIQVQTIPANPVGSLVQLISMASGLIAVLTDAAVVSRFPAVVGLPAIAIFSVPYAVRSHDLDVVRFTATALSFLLVLWLTSRFRPVGGPDKSRSRNGGRAPATALLLGAAAVTTALVLPSVTPGLEAEAFDDAAASAGFPSAYGAGIDPVIQLGRDLRRGTPLLSLSYVTTAGGPVYLKMVDLSDFSTGTWQPDAAPEVVPDETIEKLAAPAGLSDAVERSSIESTVSIEALRSGWLPLPYPATALSDAGQGWSADPKTGVVTLPSDRKDSRGDSYTVESLVLTPTAEQLAASGSNVPASLETQLALPADLPSIVSDVAREVAASSETNYGRAVALQSYFTSGDFEYSVDTPVAGDFDGTNSEALGSFLQVKSGYCVHFAAAMATMARVIGIPSRIAVGYFPSSAASSYVDGVPRYEVLTDQLHSWPELYFDGVGWLAFEPTPSLGITVPQYSLPAFARQASQAPVTAPTTQAAVPSAAPRGAVDPGSSAAGGRTDSTSAVRGWLTALGIVLLLGVGGIAPRSLRVWRRHRILSQIGSAEHPATVAWGELKNFARDYGIEVSSGDTPAGFAARIGSLRRIPLADVVLLRSSIEREQFSADVPSQADGKEREGLRTALLNIERAIAVEAEASQKRRALFLPTSLFVRSERS